MPKLIFIILLITSFIFSCGIFGENPTIRLWSETAEILPYVDHFNASQNRYKIEVLYIRSPAEELLITEKMPDLILASRLTAPHCAQKLESLTDLLTTDGVNPKLMYQELLAQHHFKNSTIALPFSFNLPVIITRKGTFKKDDSGLISLEELQTEGIKYNVTEKSKITALGFSPLWNQDFFFLSASLFGVEFRSDEEHFLTWDEAALTNCLQFFSQWCDQNGSSGREREFIQKYLYEQPTLLIGDRRSDFYRISFFQALDHAFFSIPAQKKEALDFFWLSKGGKIPASGKIMAFGVPRGSSNRAGANEFLKWIFFPATQSRILEEISVKNPHSFGIDGGFSSLVAINEEQLPKYEPRLAGRIPKEEMISFPFPLPETWEKLKEETILPLIYNWLADNKTPFPLREKIK